MEYCSDEQRAVVEAADRCVLLRGCAGSRKTDTLVKVCVRELQRGEGPRHVMIATLVGSVTNELKERLEAVPGMGITFRRTGNHFIWERAADGSCVEIANFDAMVHKQLDSHKDPFILRYGDCHNEKAALLLNKYVMADKHPGIVLLNNKRANVFLMDEFQDLQITKVRILTETIRRCPDVLKAVAAGDHAQTIFDHALGANGEHPMDAWTEALGAREMRMSLCFRCPPGHVALANAILAPYAGRFPQLEPMTAHAAASGPRPVLFTCPPASRNNTGDVVAKRVCAALEALWDSGERFVPSDVGVVMSRSNNNPVFKQLQHHMEALYRRMGLGEERVKAFETRGDGYCIPIDWAQAVGRTVLLSVHGDKGKGHRIVFFLGFNEGSVPQKQRLFTGRELVDLSLANVALTRSTRWLFVGFNRDFPSRYLRVKDLDALALLAWKAPEEQGAEGAQWARVLRAVAEERPGAPCFTNPNYVTEEVLAPGKAVLEVKDDVLPLFEHPKGLVPYYDWTRPEKARFGEPCDLSTLPDDMLPVFGCMGELLLQRELCRLLGDDTLRRTLMRPLRFVSDERVLNVAQDAGLNALVATSCTKHEFTATVGTMASQYGAYMGNPEDYKALTRLEDPHYVLPSFFRAHMDDVAAFADPALPASRLPARAAWTTTLFHMALFGKVRVPGFEKMIGRLEVRDLASLPKFLKNVEAAAGLLKDAPGLTFSVKRALTAVERRPDVVKEMGVLGGAERVPYGLIGVSDMESTDCIYEVKCPRTGAFSSAWVMQPLVYKALANDDRKTKVCVVDVTHGVAHTFPNVHNISDKMVVRKILTAAKFRPEHIASLASRLR